MYIKSQINKLPLSLWLAEESFQQYLSAPNTSRGFNPLEESFFFYHYIWEQRSGKPLETYLEAEMFT